MPTPEADFRKLFPSLCKGLDKGELEILSGQLRQRSFEAGAPVVRAGRSTGAVLFVAQGKLVVKAAGKGGPIALGRVAAGRWIGEEALFEPGPSLVDVEAEGEATVLELGRSEFEGLRRQSPRVGACLVSAFLADMAKRMRASSENLWDGPTIGEAGSSGSAGKAGGFFRSMIRHLFRVR